MRQHLTCVVCLICLSNTITLTRVFWKMRPETKVRSIMNPQTRVALTPIVDAYSKSLSEFASCPATIMTRLLYCNYEKSQRRKEGPGSQLGWCRWEFWLLYRIKIYLWIHIYQDNTGLLYEQIRNCCLFVYQEEEEDCHLLLGLNSAKRGIIYASSTWFC